MSAFHPLPPHLPSPPLPRSRGAERGQGAGGEVVGPREGHVARAWGGGGGAGPLLALTFAQGPATTSSLPPHGAGGVRSVPLSCRFLRGEGRV